MPTLQGLLGYAPPVTNQRELKKGLYAAQPEVLQAKTKKQAQGSKDFFNGLLALNQFMPVTGDVQSGLLAANDIGQGNYGQAALNAAGLLPFVPSMAGTVASKGGKLSNALKKTQYEIAHDVAQKNAVEMLGLPPNNTAMDRAKAMGFDTNAYHGTLNDFSSFDINKAGSSSKHNSAQVPAIWSSGSPKVANIFIAKNVRDDYPVAKYGPAGGGLDSIKTWGYEEGGNIMPIMIKGNPQNTLTAGEAQKMILGSKEDDWRYSGEAFADYFNKNPQFTKIKGHPMAKLEFRANQYLTPYPSSIRSRFAAFDPARANEADLLGHIDPKLLPLLGLLGGAGMGAVYISQNGKE